MIDPENQTYYEVLELAPDASQQEIRAAYLRAKAAYKKDSVALYTLISPEETETLLQKIEEAFLVLSSPERRRDYDRSHGLLTVEPPTTLPKPLARTAAAAGSKVVSIDRVPPMESGASEADLLVPPSTDFSEGHFGARPSQAAASVSGSPFGEPETDDFGLARPPVASSSITPAAPLNTPAKQATSYAIAQPAAPVVAKSIGAQSRSSALLQEDPELAREIAEETEWKGIFLRKVRDGRKVSLEEVCDFTKITRTYLLAIEDENYEKLPAAVYLRGFITQIAKYLRLPHEKVAASYMSRHAQWRQEKENQKR